MHTLKEQAIFIIDTISTFKLIPQTRRTITIELLYQPQKITIIMPQLTGPGLCAGL